MQATHSGPSTRRTPRRSPLTPSVTPFRCSEELASITDSVESIAMSICGSSRMLLMDEVSRLRWLQAATWPRRVPGTVDVVAVGSGGV